MPKKSRPRKAAARRTKTTGKRGTAGKAPAEKRPRRGKVRPPAAVPPGGCQVRTAHDDVFPILGGEALQRYAMEWDYTARHRRRWSRSARARDKLESRARGHLEKLGIGAPELERIASAGMLEVSVAFREEEKGWEGRVMPWEFLLSAATKADRGDRPLTIVRHLDRGDRPRERPQPTMALFVESAPGALAGMYEFDTERRAMVANLGTRHSKVLRNPTLDDITGFLEGERPDVVHLTGIDTHQGTARLGGARTSVHALARAVARRFGVPLDALRNRRRRESAKVLRARRICLHLARAFTALTPEEVAAHFSGVSAADVRNAAEEVGQEARGDRKLKQVLDALAGQASGFDGFFLAAKPGQEVVVPAEDLAEGLNAGGDFTPALVAFNAYNSAPRLAALAVAHGAGAALGFQGAIDDAHAELFLATFYNVWRHSGYHDLLHAFDVAWGDVREHMAGARGSGIVLWSERSLVSNDAAAYEWRQARIRGEIAPDSPHAAVERERATTISIRPERGETLQDAVERVLEVTVEPLEELNYSVLHNNGSIFERFDLRQLANGTLRGIEVEVVLHVGDAGFPYKGTFDRDNGQPPSIREFIRVPLTWDFVRTIRESVRTALYVRVRYAGLTIYEDTHRVTLPPVTEWLDNGQHGRWLPSFVLPRDAAVERIVDRAQHYLCALLDDTTAGFDGYQSYDETADDPAEAIDLQVRAIWTALLLEYDLAYINPPPSYAETSQRLRRPCDVVESRHGTCIDLTLLLASCLEYVDIYPVLFLLDGHAFPGYWRSPAGYERFLTMAGFDQEQVSLEPGGEDGGGGLPPWMCGPETYREIRTLVREDHLVPLEGVSLTARERFFDAFEKGVENVLAEDEFYAMIDVRIARQAGVTPLPL